MWPKSHLCMVACFLLSSGTAAAASRPEPDPTAYLQAFNETCRQGFPNLAAVASQAKEHGWESSGIRRADGAADVFDGLPVALHKGKIMLFLSQGMGGSFKTVCQVTGSELTRLTGAEIEAIVSPSLQAGRPITISNAEKDKALWTIAPGVTVEAGISIYRRKVRTISIAMQEAR